MSEREADTSPTAASPNGGTLGDLDGVLARRSGAAEAPCDGSKNDNNCEAVHSSEHGSGDSDEAPSPDEAPATPSAQLTRTSIFAPRATGDAGSPPSADSAHGADQSAAETASKADTTTSGEVAVSGEDTAADDSGDDKGAGSDVDITEDSDSEEKETQIIPEGGPVKTVPEVATQTAATEAPGPRHGGAGKGVKLNDDPDRPRRKWPWVAALLLALCAGGYVGAAYHYADRVPANTQVAGVDLSGMTRDDAEAALREGLAERASAPIELEIVPTQVDSEEETSTEGESASESPSPDDSAAGVAGVSAPGSRATAFSSVLPAEKQLSATLDPAQASLEVDYPASVEQVVGLTFNPAKLWKHFSGKQQLDPIITVDHDKLIASLEQVAEQVNTAPVEGALAFEGTQVVRTEPEFGYQMMIEPGAHKITNEWLRTPPPLAIPAEEQQPIITKDILDKADAEIAQQVVSGPVVVKVGSHTATLEVEDLADAATFNTVGDNLELSVDGKALAEKVAPQVPEAITEAKDATVVIEGGAPKIIPGTVGHGIDGEALSKLLPAAVSSPDQRTVEAPMQETQPAFTTEDAENLGIKEVVSEIKTPLTADNVRTTNLRMGAKYVNNTLVKPGERFSLLTALGPITPERGFVSSGVVENGVISKALGGGLSQMSTNTFNVGWLAGMKDIQHKPHGKYFSRYPAGRESTVWSPNLDMIWENNTPYGALVEAWVADGYVHTRLWSTKYWDVTTRESEPYNFTAPTTIHRSGPDCKPATGHGRGFTINVYRKIEHGSEVHEDRYTWTYTAFSNVVCD